MDRGENVETPTSLDLYHFYYHNSSEGWYKNSEGDNVLRVEITYSPYAVKVYNADGDEMASAEARKLDARGRVHGALGFDLYANKEHYGELMPYKEGRKAGYIARTRDGDFTLSLFPACTRANISANYIIEHDGGIAAVIGGSPKLEFPSAGYCQNDVLLSYDDNYMVLYATLELLLTSLNGGLLR